MTLVDPARLERHAGHDQHPVAAVGEVVAKRHPLGLADHFLEIVDVAGVDRMDAPLQAQPPRDLHAGGHRQGRHLGRSRAIRRAVDPELV